MAAGRHIGTISPMGLREFYKWECRQAAKITRRQAIVLAACEIAAALLIAAVMFIDKDHRKSAAPASPTTAPAQVASADQSQA